MARSRRRFGACNAPPQMAIRTFQRFTRRGPVFLQAPDDRNGGGGAATDSNPNPGEQVETAQPVDYKAVLLDVLSLGPDAADADITAKAEELRTQMASLPSLQEQAATATDAATRLEQATAENVRLQGEFQRLYDEQEAARKAQQEAEVDTILEQFSDRLTDEKARARIRAILISDREAGMEILNGLPAAAATTSATGGEEKKDPPAPVHQPNNGDPPQMSADEKAAEAEKLIKDIKAEGKFTDYTSAREEARRRKPELFS
jgi:hypothetical protein